MSDIVNTRNQHYLPRFLLRGFSWCEDDSIKKKRRKYCTYRCYKDSEPRIEYIEHVASEKYFYERVIRGETSIEEALSTKENSLSQTLNKILRSQKVHKSQWPNVSRLVAQTAIRTKHLRMSFTHMGNTAVSHAWDMAQRPENFSNAFSKGLDKAFLENSGRVATAREHQQLGYLMPHAKKDITKFVNAKLSTFDLSEKSAESQSNVVTKEEDIAIHRYGKFEWKYCFTEDELILGDVGVLAFNKNSDGYEPVIFVPSTSIDHVILPVESHGYLLGNMMGENERATEISTDALNWASATLSKEFLIAQSSTAITDKIRTSIGLEYDKWMERMTKRTEPE